MSIVLVYVQGAGEESVAFGKEVPQLECRLQFLSRSVSGKEQLCGGPASPSFGCWSASFFAASPAAHNRSKSAASATCQGCHRLPIESLHPAPSTLLYPGQVPSCVPCQALIRGRGLAGRGDLHYTASLRGCRQDRGVQHRHRGHTVRALYMLVQP